MRSEKPIDIQGHRGARALFPDNTLQGFRAAAALGVTAFELDVGMTADGIVVLSHDVALNPDITRDPDGAWLTGPGPAIRTLTLAELSRYDVGRVRPGSPTAALYPDRASYDGAGIPTLAAVLAALPAARFTIEAKTDPVHPGRTASAPALADAIVATIDAAGAGGRVIVESFDWRVQRHIRKTRPDIGLAWLTRAATIRDAAIWWDIAGPTDGLAAAAVAAEGGPIWAPDHTTLTEVRISEAHALGLRVLAWTVNRPADMVRLAGWGVDGMISDRPDVALREMSRLGLV